MLRKILAVLYTALALGANAALAGPALAGDVADLREGADWFNRLYDNREGLVKVILRP